MSSFPVIDRVEPHTYGLRLDESVGLVMPWYTHPALDEIQTWDLAGKRVHEWGGGCSTFWWSRKCASVMTYESSQEWADWIEQTARERKFENIVVRFQHPLFYPCCSHRIPDIVCVDGAQRTECLRTAVSLIFRPLTIICDNWQQDFVYIDPAAEALMAPYDEYKKLYVQPDHTNHEGRPWTTAIWRLP